MPLPLTGNPSTVDQRVTIIAVMISTAFTVAIVFFTIGCTCGWCGHKYKISTQAKSNKNTSTPAAPLYEYIQPMLTSRMPCKQEKEFELKENVAYGPWMPMKTM